MKKILITLTLILLLLAGWFVFGNPKAILFAPRDSQEQPATSTAASTNRVADKEITVFADDLSVPWGIAFLPSGNLLVTERTGRISEFTSSGEQVWSTEIPTVSAVGEGGLLGVAVHPEFSLEDGTAYFYVYETFKSGDEGTKNRVVRYRYASELSSREIIVDNLAGASYHDGGRIAFGPEGYLYVTVGDAGSPETAQDTNTRNGAILRVNPDGSTPASNPFGNAIYSYGHRNPQGLAWDAAGNLWATEHGRSGIRSGLDEVNRIQAGGNYGWPYFEGDEVCGRSAVYAPEAPGELSGNNCDVIAPIAHSGEEVTWAPASAAIVNDRLFWTGLRGQALYTASITDGRIGDITTYFKERFGRLRTVAVGPAETYLYLTTSNTDGRGNPQESDDKLIRIPVTLFSR